MIDKTQKQIIRQSSLKAAIDFHKLNGNSDISENDVIQTAYNFGYWCATGETSNNNNDKLLK
tara:strand:+ start:454 stop:639 length:186 start_codon:yes stop_codon:yes gene_type:complete